MKRIIKSTTDISLKEKTSGNFTPDEVVELLSAIEELKSKYIKAVDRGDGKLDFCIGDDVYETDKGIAVKAQSSYLKWCLCKSIRPQPV